MYPFGAAAVVGALVRLVHRAPAARSRRARSGLARWCLRVSIPALLLMFGMGGFAARFAQTFLAVEREMDGDDRVVDLAREGYDVVVRANPSPESELVGRRFPRTPSVLASPPGMPLPRHTDESVDTVVLSTTRSQSTWTVVIGSEGELRVIPREILRFSTMTPMDEAVLAGPALLPGWVIRRDLAEGRLKVRGSVPNRDLELWALHPPGHLTSPKVRAFADLLADEFQKSETAEYPQAQPTVT